MVKMFFSRLLLGVALALCLVPSVAPVFGANTGISPQIRQRFFDNNGIPCNGCKLFSYAAGTTTKQSTFTDFGGATPNTNPVVLDANGYADVWLTTTQAYKFTLSPSTDTDPPTGALWTVDNLNQTSTGPIIVNDTGAVNAYVATPSPPWTAYTASQIIYFKIGAGNTNTAGSTINISGLGLRNILNQDLSATEVNALRAGSVYLLAYDGTQFEIIGKNNSAPTQANGNNSTQIATTAFVYQSVPAGAVMDYAGLTTPTGWLLCDGTAVSRTTYAALLAAITNAATVTITIAAPGVVSWVGHGIPENGPVTLATTGALPTGLAVATTYYAKSVTADTFQLSATPGGASINTTGTQSGVHTGTFYPYASGDGSTTFNVPDFRGRARVAKGTGTLTVSVDASQVSVANDDFTIPTNVDTIVTGMKGQFTTTVTLPTGLSLATDYFLIRTTATTFNVATTLTNAQAGVAINITGQGSGVHTFTNTLSARTVGQRGGEETHAMSSTELLAHTHLGGTGSAVGGGGGANTAHTVIATQSAGGNAAMNVMQPFGVVTTIIKY